MDGDYESSQALQRVVKSQKLDAPGQVLLLDAVRDMDSDYEQGQVICMRGKLARCTMNLNNSSWKIIEDICPESSLRGLMPWLASLPSVPASSLPSC